MSAGASRAAGSGAGDGIVAPGAAVERFVTGFRFTEGPVWDAARQRLIFSDITGNAMHSADAAGRVRIYRQPSRHANGSTLDRAGRLVSCEHSTSRVVREDRPGRLVTLADTWQGRALNSPNDVIVDRSGAIWFTDPTYGRMARFGLERPQELPFQGVFRLDLDGTLALVADDFDQPNGLCLSLDERHLYVSDTRRFHIRRFAVDAAGRARGGEVLAETPPDGRPGCPDGLKFDSAGRLFSCGPGGIHVFDPAGQRLAILGFPEEPANFTWGGAGLATLYVTAESSIYRLAMQVPGRPHEQE
jgi:gluconolactonase